jgi:hypothetical protein
VTTQTDQFQFVDLSRRSKGQQAKNRFLVRSHVTKVSRRARRKRPAVAGQNKELLDQKAESHPQIHDSVAHFLQSRAPSPGRIAQRPAMDSTISALHTFEGRVTPHLYELLELSKAYNDTGRIRLNHLGQTLRYSFRLFRQNTADPLLLRLAGSS